MTLTVNQRLEDGTLRGLGSYWGCDLDKKQFLPCRFEQVEGDVHGGDSIVTHLEPQTRTKHRRQQPRSAGQLTLTDKGASVVLGKCQMSGSADERRLWRFGSRSAFF